MSATIVEPPCEADYLEAIVLGLESHGLRSMEAGFAARAVYDQIRNLINREFEYAYMDGYNDGENDAWNVLAEDAETEMVTEGRDPDPDVEILDVVETVTRDGVEVPV